MWCIPKLDKPFIERMEETLDLYEKPYDRQEPVVCFDEKSKQLLCDIRAPLKAKEGKVLRRDYEYKRNGTRNIFVAVEPKGGFRTTRVTKRRTKQDTAKELKRIITLKRYKKVKKIHIVLDNLNTHFKKSFIETYGKKETDRLLENVEFHYTPTHASWLNMAEIEISVLSRQCTQGRIPTEKALRNRIARWQRRRNAQKATINWLYTTQDARKTFKYKKKSKLI